MLLAQRPRTPAGFNRRARAARAQIRSLIQKSLIQKGERPKSGDFDSIWSEFKYVLARAQNNRCGYCDRKVLGGDDGTVDHYRPKAEIEALYDDRATWGQQKEHSASVTGRMTQPVSDFGYHWLAYAWINYVFACSCCNEKWKRALFPVVTHPRCCPPRARGHEEPLLMNCYGHFRPSEHIQFNDDGTVEPRNGSRIGYETIRTVGLYRDPLCDEREDVALRTYGLLEDFGKGNESQAIRGLCGLGHARRQFAGVVRAIVEHEMEMSWDDFLEMWLQR